jgi:hypothetical protein
MGPVQPSLKLLGLLMRFFRRRSGLRVTSLRDIPRDELRGRAVTTE